MSGDRFLIEVSIPLEAISAQAVRERFICRQISTLYIWGARSRGADDGQGG
jgi:hypothetical protein